MVASLPSPIDREGGLAILTRLSRRVPFAQTPASGPARPYDRYNQQGLPDCFMLHSRAGRNTRVACVALRGVHP